MHIDFGAGHVRAYDWDGSSWNNIGEFDGLAANDDFGKAVDSDASGSILIISAPRNDTPASRNGLVVVADIILDQEYTATFTPSSDGATTIDIAAGVSKDYSGNNNTAADQFNWTYDSTAPTITSSGLVSDNSAIAVTFRRITIPMVLVGRCNSNFVFQKNLPFRVQYFKLIIPWYIILQTVRNYR